jgi:hypothetical protein
MINNGVQSRPSAWLWIFISIATALWILPELVRQDLYDGDAAHHVYWTYKYADPDLFPDDFGSEYFANPAIVPKGYDALYRVLTPVLDAQVASELVGAALFALALFLAWRVGSYAAGAHPAMAGWAMMLLIAVAISELHLLPPMGLQRAFALPLTLAAVLALMRGRLVLLGFVFLAAALFYPIVCATLGICSALYLGLRLLRERRLPQGWLPLLVLGSTALFVISLASTPEAIGPMVTKAQALAMPEFGPGGRQGLFGEGLRALFAHHRTGLGFPPKWVLLSLGVAGFLAWRRSLGEVPGVAWALLGAALLVWVVSRLTLFLLYLPERHTVWALPVTLGMLAATSVPAVVQLVGHRIARSAMAVAGTLALAFHAWGMLDQWKTPRDADLEAAYEYLRTLPPDTLVAAHPVDADDVQMRARRSVLVSQETSISFMLGYYGRAKERLEASLRATYATDWCTVDALGSRWGVDVFLVTAYPWEYIGYDEPLNSLAQSLFEEGRSQGFVLRDPPPGRILFESGDVTVVRVEQCDSTA